MPAIISDQFRILNAANFVAGVADTSQYYYSFIGLPNSQDIGAGYGQTDWNTNTPAPMDGFKEYNDAWDTMLGLKQLSSDDVQRMVKKTTWTAGTVYEMYKNGYTRENQSPKTSSTNLYDAQYYVVNSDLKVYLCINNGQSPDNPQGRQSLDEPNFVDLEPRAAGTSGDGYIWKYLYTIKPAQIIKFDSIEYIVLPNNWSTSTDPQVQAVREAGDSDINSNQIKTVYIRNQGNNYTDGSYSCNILGDGTGARALVTIDGDVVTNVVVTAGGSGYTFGMVDLSDVTFSGSESDRANLIPIIPPSKGHGFDIYTELGADKVLVYSRFDDSTKDFPTDTHFAQVGIIKNPNKFDVSGIMTASQFSSLSAIKLSSPITTVSDLSTLIGAGIAQTVTGGTARATVASYDPDTFVLKYFQDRSLNFNQSSSDTTDYQNMNSRAKVLSFESTDSSEKTITGSGSASFTSSIDAGFTGITTTVGNKQVNLGIEFTKGLANSEINKKTGDVIYIDNRKEVERNIRQKEDVKIILEF